MFQVSNIVNPICNTKHLPTRSASYIPMIGSGCFHLVVISPVWRENHTPEKIQDTFFFNRTSLGVCHFIWICLNIVFLLCREHVFFSFKTWAEILGFLKYSSGSKSIISSFAYYPHLFHYPHHIKTCIYILLLLLLLLLLLSLLYIIIIIIIIIITFN